MSSVEGDLKEAISGESQAHSKYQAFAKKAEKDGFPNVAKLFLTTSAAELIHAEGHMKALGLIGSTAENLQAAIAGETYEFTDMYPPMAELAEVEGHRAKRMFNWALEAEKVHAQLYQAALEAVESGKDLSEGEFYLCPVCGHIEFGKPEEACPICGVKAGMYIQV
ncbi:MAG TPA: rubrerythrin family protein [Anaerolineae bacterium]|nr:rubrerythrin family protein [Anaerolineae bacterium]